MSSTEAVRSAKASKEEFDAVSIRLALALAKRESLIKSWTASSSRPLPPAKAQEELDAEDAAIFRNEPSYLGVGAPIPSHFLVNEAERNNKSLHAKFFPLKGFRASKARDSEEKAASAKRGLKDESSDEEEGRSGLGRAKKLKTKVALPQAVEYMGTGEMLSAPPKPYAALQDSTETNREARLEHTGGVGVTLGHSKDIKSKTNRQQSENCLESAVAQNASSTRDTSHEFAQSSTDVKIRQASSESSTKKKKKKKKKKTSSTDSIQEPRKGKVIEL